MRKRATPRSMELRGEFLTPWGESLRTEKLILPGWEGEHPLLTFVLKVLNGRNRSLLRKHLKGLLYFDFQTITIEMGDAWRAMQRPEVLDYAVSSMMSITRFAADLWIDSGKSPLDSNVDTPADRNVEVVLPGQSFSLFQLCYQRLFSRFPQYAGMFKDGTQRIDKKFPQFTSEDLEMGLKAALEDYGVRIALFYFAELLNSRDSRRIARCDHCKRYFAYERIRLRTVKNGVSCPKCAPKSSVKRTERSREKRLDTAAKAWLNSNSLPRKRRESSADWENRRREWVAEQVNETHNQAFGRRWVSQNLNQIQERVEALRNAKG